MAQMIKGPTRFTHPEWTLSNQTKYRTAELERKGGEHLMAECDRLENETKTRTEITMKDVNKKLDQRVNDIKYWTDELNNKLEDTHSEIDKLKVYINRMEKAIESGTQEPLHIAQTCLSNREGRVGIDLVHDDVQRELLKEVEVHHGVQALLQKTLEQAKEQLRLNRKAKYRLEQDIKKKEHARGLDEFCSELKPNSKDIDFVASDVGIDSNSVTPEEWRDATESNVKYAERQRQNSLQIRSIIDGILQQTSNDQKQQVELTNRAFKRRIAEVRDAKGKLEEHIARVIKEISNMEDNIENLRISIKEKEQPMKLAQTRLEVRKQRQGSELCRDSVMYRTVEEVHEIKADVGQLQSRLRDSVAALKRLRSRQLDLEEDVQVKASSLFIDEVECVGIRQSILINSY